jgi:hypothetical protein
MCQFRSGFTSSPPLPWDYSLLSMMDFCNWPAYSPRLPPVWQKYKTRIQGALGSMPVCWVSETCETGSIVGVRIWGLMGSICLYPWRQWCRRKCALVRHSLIIRSVPTVYPRTLDLDTIPSRWLVGTAHLWNTLPPWISGGTTNPNYLTPIITDTGDVDESFRLLQIKFNNPLLPIIKSTISIAYRAE